MLYAHTETQYINVIVSKIKIITYFNIDKKITFFTYMVYKLESLVNTLVVLVAGTTNILQYRILLFR